MLVYQRVTDIPLCFLFFSAGCSCFMMFFGGFQALKNKKSLVHSCLAPTLQYVELRFICLYSTLGYLWIFSWGTCWYKEFVIHGDQHLWKHPSLRMDPSFRLHHRADPKQRGSPLRARRVAFWSDLRWVETLVWGGIGNSNLGMKIW